MKRQKDTARQDRMDSGKNDDFIGGEATVYEQLDPALSSTFVGYDRTEHESKIFALALFSEEGQSLSQALTDGEEGAILTEETPFYGTMGGQLGDCGRIETEDAVFEE